MLIGMAIKNSAAAAQLLKTLAKQQCFSEMDMMVAITCVDPDAAAAIAMSL